MYKEIIVALIGAAASIGAAFISADYFVAKELESLKIQLAGSVSWGEGQDPIAKFKRGEFKAVPLNDGKLRIEYKDSKRIPPIISAVGVKGDYDTFVQVVDRGDGYFLLQSFTVTDGKRVAVPASVDFVAVFPESDN